MLHASEILHDEGEMGVVGEHVENGVDYALVLHGRQATRRVDYRAVRFALHDSLSAKSIQY